MRSVVSVLGVLPCNSRLVSARRLGARRRRKVMRELAPAHHFIVRSQCGHAVTQNVYVKKRDHHSSADWGGLNAIGGTGSDASMLRALAIVSGAYVLDASYLFGV